MWFTRRRDPRIHDELQRHRDALVEDVKDVPGRWVDDLTKDLRCGARNLRRNPAYATAAVATLALAIASSTAMFSVLNVVLLRPLPYVSPDRLAMVWREDPAQNLREGRSALDQVAEWRVERRSFADLATYDAVSATLSGDDGAEQIVGGSISPNLLSVLGVQPMLGRGLSTEEASRNNQSS